LFIRRRQSRRRRPLPRFNPSVGILFVHTYPANTKSACYRPVSIPRSGFCLFIRIASLIAALLFSCFNPSVGILFVHTIYRFVRRLFNGQFQSLGRDSVCSYHIFRKSFATQWLVSIPRSGFCLFIPTTPVVGGQDNARFNPSVGILFVHTSAVPLTRIISASFNPSVGILFVHTRRGLAPPRFSGPFQSLGRDSVCSYKSRYEAYAVGRQVSIPRSGFCLFIRATINRYGLGDHRFNPSVGILFVHTRCRRSEHNHRRKFQSLGRDSVCSYMMVGRD